MPARPVLLVLCLVLAGCLQATEQAASGGSGEEDGADEGIGDPCEEPEVYTGQDVVVFNRLNRSIVVELVLRDNTAPMWNGTVEVDADPGGYSYTVSNSTELPAVAPGRYMLTASVASLNETHTDEVFFECDTFGIVVRLDPEGMLHIGQGAA